MDYVCKHCGSAKVCIKPSGRRYGVYCSECDSWIEWTTLRGALEFHKDIDPEALDEHMALRKYTKRNNRVTLKCSKCGCLLNDSLQLKVRGQFDLINARFCPNCGRELI